MKSHKKNKFISIPKIIAIIELKRRRYFMNGTKTIVNIKSSNNQSIVDYKKEIKTLSRLLDAKMRRYDKEFSEIDELMVELKKLSI